MNVFTHVEARIGEALEALKSDGVLPADLAIPRLDAETPRDPSHGDMASNAAMMLAKAAKMKPRDLAEKIKDKTGRPARIEGLTNADWMLIDAGDVIVHLFRPEVRSFYNLERMWGFVDAPVAGTA